MVTGTLKGFSFDGRLIWADVEYNIDGEIKNNPYPIQKSNIVGLTAEQVTDWLRVNIIFQCDTYITVKFRDIEKTKSDFSADSKYYVDDYHAKTYTDKKIADDTEENLIKDVLNPLINNIYSRDTAPLVKGYSTVIGTDVNGEPITEFTVTDRIDIKSDGTYIEKVV